jgi:hypothetical protein
MCQVKDAPIRDWVKLAVTRAATRACRRCSGSTRTARTRTSSSRRSSSTCRTTTPGPGHPDHEPGARDALHARARGARPGHHQRHRQHPARLPDRPVPDHGAGHQRQDAVHRAADGRRRHVRDRRGRLGAQARAAAGRGEPPALGFAGRVPRAGGEPGGPGPEDRQRKAKILATTRWTPPPASCWTTASRRRRRPASSTTAAASSTWRCTGRRQLAAQTEDAELAAHFAPLAKALADNEATIIAELAAVQGKPVDIGGYYKADDAKVKAVMRPSATFNRGCWRAVAWRSPSAMAPLAWWRSTTLACSAARHRHNPGPSNPDLWRATCACWPQP